MTMIQSSPAGYDDLIEQASFFLLKVLGDEGKAILEKGLLIDNIDDQVLYFEDLLEDMERLHHGDSAEALDTSDQYIWRPVGIREFVCDEYFLNKAEDIYPIVMDELEEMNSGKYVEIVLTGGIGSAKTTSALYTNAYQVYLLSCLKNPHKLYGLDKASEILLVFQSITATLASGVDYDRFKAMIESCRYFKDHFPFDRDIKSRLIFPHRIEVKPISGADTAAIGQNVMGGLIDELNYMALVEKSKHSIDRGVYDQAVALYNSISRRRKSRFMKQGKLPGILCLVSSKRYPGQFTDIKEREAKEEIAKYGSTSIYIYDKRVWEIAPPDRFSGRWFQMFIGDDSRKPRILDADEVVQGIDAALVMDIPEEYRPDFERDPMNALRDIAGVSTLALFPFFQSREDVNEMFGQHLSILSDIETDFVTPPLQILKSRFWKPNIPRWIHVDLSLNKDATGVSCACCPGFAAVSRGDDDHETLPQIRFDFQLKVVPPRGGEILFHNIRSLIYSLRELGLNIKWVSFDSFQSIDMQQILRQQGFITGEVSMDKTTLPYEVLKTACYDHRVSAPYHPPCEKELVGLEMDPKVKKIDHPPLGSKDVADSMAGATYGLTMRRETWIMYDISVIRMPSSLKDLMERERERMRAEGDIAGILKQDGYKVVDS